MSDSSESLDPASRRITAPTHEPYAPLLALRANGWTIEAVAEAVNASARAVCRWNAGDTVPLPVYADAINRLLAEDEAAGNPKKASKEDNVGPRDPHSAKRGKWSDTHHEEDL